MGMFGSGGGGDFNPNDWVDYKVYNEVMKNDTTSSTKSNTNSSKEVKIKNTITKKYRGNHLYLIVPDEILNASKIDLMFTIRTYRYTYRLKGE